MLRSKWTSQGMVMEDVDPGPLAPGQVRLNVSALRHLRLRPPYLWRPQPEET